MISLHSSFTPGFKLVCFTNTYSGATSRGLKLHCIAITTFPIVRLCQAATVAAINNERSRCVSLFWCSRSWVLDGTDLRITDSERGRDRSDGVTVQCVSGSEGHVAFQRTAVSAQLARHCWRHAEHDVSVHRTPRHDRRRNLHRYAGKPVRKVHLLDQSQGVG